MSGENNGKISRRDFLKLAAGAGIGAAAIGTGLSSFLQNIGSITTPAYAQGNYGAIGSPITLNIGYLPYAADIITANLVKNLSLWKKYLPLGSSVNWLRFLGGVLVTNNMLANKVQIGYMGDMPSYRCLDVVDSKVICLGSYEQGLTGKLAMAKFGEPKSTLQAIVVRPDVAYKYKTPEDLNGATIGVPLGSIGHKQAITIQKDGWETDGVPAAIAKAPAGNSIFYPAENKTIGALLEISGIKKGIQYGNLLDLSTELQIAQLRAHTIEVVCTWEPYVLWMEHMGVGKRFITSTDTLCQCRTGTHFHVSSPILARTDFINARPDIVEGYLQAEEDAKQMITTNLGMAAKAISMEIPDVPIEIIQKDLAMMVYDGRIHPEMLEHHRRSARLSQQLGIYRGERTGYTPEQAVNYGYGDSSHMNNVIQKRKTLGKWTSASHGILRNW